MPPLSLAACQAKEPFHRVLHAVPMTTDTGFHYVPDTIALAEEHHRTVNPYLNSRNVKPSYNGRKAAKAGLGVTGGFLIGAEDGDYNRPMAATVTIATATTDGPRKGHRSGRNRKRGTKPQRSVFTG